MISVICTSDPKLLHLAPEEKGLGASVFTLCLEKWSTREPARTDSTFCAECVARWAAEHQEAK